MKTSVLMPFPNLVYLDSHQGLACSRLLDHQQVSPLDKGWRFSLDFGLAPMENRKQAKLGQIIRHFGASPTCYVGKRPLYGGTFWIWRIVIGKLVAYLSVLKFQGAALAWQVGSYKTTHPP